MQILSSRARPAATQVGDRTSLRLCQLSHAGEESGHDQHQKATSARKVIKCANQCQCEQLINIASIWRRNEQHGKQQQQQLSATSGTLSDIIECHRWWRSKAGATTTLVAIEHAAAASFVTGSSALGEHIAHQQHLTSATARSASASTVLQVHR